MTQREAREADLHEQRITANGTERNDLHGLVPYETEVAQTGGDPVRRCAVLDVADTRRNAQRQVGKPPGT